MSPIFTPLYHAGGLGAFLMPILLAGGTIVLHREFDPTEVWRVIEEERCTVVLGVPTIWKMLADAPEFQTADLSSCALVHLRRRADAAPPGRCLPRARGGDAAGLRSDRGRGQLLRHVRRGGLGQGGLDRPAADVHRGAGGRRGRPGSCRRTRSASSAFADPTSAPATGTTPRRPRRPWTKKGGSTPGTWRGVTRTASSTSPAAPRTCSSRAGSTSTRRRSRTSLLQHPSLADAAVVGVPHATWGEVGVAFVVPAEEKR